MSLVSSMDGFVEDDYVNCSNGVKKSSDLNANIRPDKVSSVRIVDEVPRDFRCTICKKLPSSLNRSELYRHYALRHFYNTLMKEFGHLKTCPVCNLDLTKTSTASHFGQKHSQVEHFLPVEAWIPISKAGVSRAKGWLARCGKGSEENSSRNGRKFNKVKKVERKENFLKGVPLVWPETEPYIIATVNGFDIELEIEDEQENLMQSSDSCSTLASAHKQVIQCRICKERFNSKQLVVLHVQRTHAMKVSGDELHEYEALLRSGHISLEKSKSPTDVPALNVDDLVEYTSGSTQADFQPQSLGLELVMDADNFQQLEPSQNVAEGSLVIEGGKIEEDWENVCEAFIAKLEASGIKVNPIEGKEAVDKSDKEWEVACAVFKSRIADICYQSDVLGMNNAKDWGEVFAVESIEDLQDEAPGRETWCKVISGYISQSRVDSS